MVILRNFAPTPRRFAVYILVRGSDFVILPCRVWGLPNQKTVVQIGMDIGRRNQHPGIFLAIPVAIPQDLGRKHSHPVMNASFDLVIDLVAINVDLDRHSCTPLHKGYFPMVQVVGIVPQFINADCGICDVAHNNPHIPAIVMRGFQKRIPIKRGG